MSTDNIKNNIVRDNARITGVKKNSLGLASITVDTVPYTPPQIIAIYQADLDAQAAVATARTALAAVMAKAKPLRVTTAPFDKAFRRYVEGTYGSAPDLMSDFGVVIKVAAPRTAAQKAAAAAKAKATRALRHTMGSKQKAAIAPAQLAVQMVVTPIPSAASVPMSTAPLGEVTPVIVAK
jgi:hypothetical protein